LEIRRQLAFDGDHNSYYALAGNSRQDDLPGSGSVGFCRFSATPFRAATVAWFAPHHHDAGMDSSQVTRRQARIIKGRLQPTLDYLTRLRQRMAKLGCHPDDELMKLVGNAETALHTLCVDLLIRTEEGPTALPPKPDSPPPMEAKSKREFNRRLSDSR
jgi:hypothetical protein